MADKKQVVQVKGLEREYVVPLRKEWTKASRYKRTAKSVRAIKEFVAKHMKVPDRDTRKVKLDVYLNNEMWFRGSRKPMNKVKIKAKKEGDNVIVELVNVPEVVKFAKARQEKRHKKDDKKKEESVKEKEDKDKKEGLEDKVETEAEKEGKKKKEEEKEKSVEQANIKHAELDSKAQKHLTKAKTPTAHRKALKK